jgi:hypothetical protein
MMARLEPNDSHPNPWNLRRVSDLAIHLFVWSAIIAAALLNFTRSIRADDVWSLRTASLTLPGLLSAVRADVHPPLYFLLLQAWSSVFGPNELSGRLLPGFFHVAATFVVFALGRRLASAQETPAPDSRADALVRGRPPGRHVQPEAIGLLCAAIYAFAPLAVLSAELIRMYSLAGLLSAAAVWFWLASASEDARPRDWAGLTLAVALGSFTHIWMLCLFAGLGVASVVHFPRRTVKLLAAIAVALLPFTFVWLPVLVAQVANSGESAAWLKPPSFQTLGELVFLHLGVTPLFLLLFLSPLFRRRQPATALPAWALTLYAATLLPPLLISFWRPFFFPRFTIVALPALAIALGCLLSRIKPAPLAASIAALALVFFIGSKAGSPVCDAKCAADALLGQVASSDAIVFGSLSRPAVDYYLSRSANRERRERVPHEHSFPSAIDSHPGYEGAHLRANDLAPLRREAEATVSSFVRNGIRHVYFLAGYRRQVDAPLIDALKQRYRQEPSLLKCTRGDYFTEILVFEHTPSSPQEGGSSRRADRTARSGGRE